MPEIWRSCGWLVAQGSLKGNATSTVFCSRINRLTLLATPPLPLHTHPSSYPPPSTHTRLALQWCLSHHVISHRQTDFYHHCSVGVRCPLCSRRWMAARLARIYWWRLTVSVDARWCYEPHRITMRLGMAAARDDVIVRRKEAASDRANICCPDCSLWLIDDRQN